MKPMSLPELEYQHQSLEQQIKRLERRGMHMTPSEVERSIELKRRRLLTKDRILDLSKRPR
jgi:uncharacterized protein YdcH (DUF465 family)